MSSGLLECGVATAAVSGIERGCKEIVKFVRACFPKKDCSLYIDGGNICRCDLPV